jgi:hypothetical protein
MVRYPERGNRQDQKASGFLIATSFGNGGTAKSVSNVYNLPQE